MTTSTTSIDARRSATPDSPGEAPAARRQPFYLTTPIYYVNGRPHIGNAYTTLAADAIARYHRQRERDVLFVTGTDEHGSNNERAALARGLAPQAHVDELAGDFQALWRQLNVRYDRFVRTTEPAHRRAALELWRRLQASGDLYRDVYQGAYCPRCEAYYTADELIPEESAAPGAAGAAAADTERTTPAAPGLVQAGPVAGSAGPSVAGDATGGTHDGALRCPIHHERCEIVNEENTFFRLSRYQQPLEDLVAQTDFVQPESRRNEVLSVLRGGLRDFSVTRQNVRWGIPVPEAPQEVLYVWVDALASYLSGAGFPDDDATFERYWPADVHLIGKDILRFHCLYWPALLLSAGLPLPRRVFAHGWITAGGRKLSKSLGNTIDPAALAARYGADAVRYFFLRAIPFGQDGDYTEGAFVARYNADLANDFGNLVQRATSLVSRFASGRVPSPGAPQAAEVRLRDHAAALAAEVDEAFDRLRLDAALEAVARFVAAANRYAEETAPWRLGRSVAAGEDTPARLRTVLYHLAAAARLACWYLAPFIPATAAEGHRRLCGREPLPGLGVFGALAPGDVVVTAPPLVPRAAAEAVDSRSRRT